uniref:Uncharacterized protein n=1 Tax=Noctiluca scintillans TaxID=2966 RepID=A0A7S1AIT6_NOCSC|mmetsp:Transcript_48083/g.127306  ORF Transcript_48083/g.127306 Transcript_48083/m.127306 type:complete len:284 (+) Transcript_48083:52-903(+)
MEEHGCAELLGSIQEEDEEHSEGDEQRLDRRVNMPEFHLIASHFERRLNPLTAWLSDLCRRVDAHASRMTETDYAVNAMRKEISALKDVSSAISPSLNDLRRELGESEHQDQVVPLLWSEALVIALEEVEAMRKDIPCRIETCRAEVLDAVSQLRKTTTLLSEDVVHCRAETNAINECLESVKQELANGLTDCEFSPDTAPPAQYDELALKAKEMKPSLISNGDNLADMYSKSNTLNQAIDVGPDKNVFHELTLVAEDSDEEIFLMEEDVTDDRQPVKVWAYL